MPPRVLQVVAVLIGLCAVGGFALGVTTGGGRGRLPGEVGPGGAGAALVATDARPVEVLPPLPPPPEPVPDPEAEAKAKAEADAEKLKLAEAKLAAQKAAAAKTEAAPPPDKVGDLLDAVTPPPAEDPPF